MQGSQAKASQVVISAYNDNLSKSWCLCGWFIKVLLILVLFQMWVWYAWRFHHDMGFPVWWWCDFINLGKVKLQFSLMRQLSSQSWKNVLSQFFIRKPYQRRGMRASDQWVLWSWAHGAGRLTPASGQTAVLDVPSLRQGDSSLKTTLAQII